ncbi:MAG TPA: hypothetical protein PKV71_09065 [Calditrichia bacterium]|nr:hypothetical protein [Calditrichota bacterium]HQV32014.1 hypothetical protein [Calditrichia bacterium]
MKKIIPLIIGIILLGALYYAFSRNTATGKGGPSGVILAPPPEFTMTDIEDRAQALTPEMAAQRLALLQAQDPRQEQIGLRYHVEGRLAFFLADFRADQLQHTLANEYGTAVQTTWKGAIRQRLEWAQKEGSFEVPGLSDPITRNLYH